MDLTMRILLLLLALLLSTGAEAQSCPQVALAGEAGLPCFRVQTPQPGTANSAQLAAPKGYVDSAISLATTSLRGTIPVINPSSGNYVGSGTACAHEVAWTDQNATWCGDVYNYLSTDPSAYAVIAVSGTHVAGDAIHLTLTFDSISTTVNYTINSADAADTSGVQLAASLVCAIANTSALFDRNGKSCIAGVVSPNVQSAFGGYKTGKPIGYTVFAGNTINFDYDLRKPLTASYTVTGSGSTVLAFQGGSYNDTPVAGGSTRGTTYQMPNPWDNNPAVLFGRLVSGARPSAGSTIMAMYATGNNSDSLTSLNLNYGTFAHVVGSSLSGQTRSAWLASTITPSGALGAGTYLGQGIFGNVGCSSPLSLVQPGSGAPCLTDQGGGTINEYSYYAGNQLVIDYNRNVTAASVSISGASGALSVFDRGGSGGGTTTMYRSSGVTFLYDGATNIAQFTSGYGYVPGQMIATSFRGTPSTPASSSATCTTGEFRDDANYHYYCYATNAWRRVAYGTGTW